MKIYTGDLEPALEITLSDKDGADFDATDATAIRIIGTLGATEVFDRAPTSITHVGLTTVLTMNWQTGDTDTAGRVKLEVEVMWPGDRPQTIRPAGIVTISTDHDAVPA